MCNANRKSEHARCVAYFQEKFDRVYDHAAFCDWEFGRARGAQRVVEIEGELPRSFTNEVINSLNRVKFRARGTSSRSDFITSREISNYRVERGEVCGSVRDAVPRRVVPFWGRR